MQHMLSLIGSSAKPPAVADAVRVEAAKRYRSGWQYRVDLPGMCNWCGYARTKGEALRAGRAAAFHHLFAHQADDAECSP